MPALPSSNSSSCQQMDPFAAICILRERKLEETPSQWWPSPFHLSLLLILLFLVKAQESLYQIPVAINRIVSLIHGSRSGMLRETH